MAWDSRHTQLSLWRELGWPGPRNKNEKKQQKTVFKIMELPGKNILHDSLCGKYLFLSVSERGLSRLVPFSTPKPKP